MVEQAQNKHLMNNFLSLSHTQIKIYSWSENPYGKK